MATARYAPTVIASIATIQASPGPLVEKVWMALGKLSRLYRWAYGSAATTDGVTVLAGSGGAEGRWILQRTPDKGANLTDADATIQVGEEFWRAMPVATLTANRAITLGTTNAAEGDILEITRLDVGAYTLAIINGGAGAGTLITMPVSSRYWAAFYFDGTNWSLRRGGAMAT